MIIAIASNKNDFKALVDPQFGKCNWFCLYDTETHQSSFIENPASQNQENAGCDATELLLGENISMAIAGRFGSKVVDVFRTNNIQMVIPEIQQTLSEIINHIK